VVGVLQRFERRLEGLVEGAFARAFRSTVQPVEIASALQRETADRAAIVGAGRTLVPNDFVVELGTTDHERLAPYAETLGEEFAGLMRDYAGEEGYSHVGPVHVRFEQHDDLDTGTFRIRSDVVRGAVDDAPESAAAAPGTPRLITGAGGPRESAYVLRRPVTVIGRGEDADLRIADPGASRRHAELRRENDRVVLADLGSTNGTLVNGNAVGVVALRPGDEITIGETVLVYADGTGSSASKRGR
jgi:hypothetical protein